MTTLRNTCRVSLAENNVAECSFDGGDCCQFTCASSFNAVTDTTTACEGPYNCVDPLIQEGAQNCASAQEAAYITSSLNEDYILSDVYSNLSDPECVSNLVPCVTSFYNGFESSSTLSIECGEDCVLPFYLCTLQNCKDQCSSAGKAT